MRSIQDAPPSTSSTLELWRLYKGALLPSWPHQPASTSHASAAVDASAETRTSYTTLQTSTASNLVAARRKQARAGPSHCQHTSLGALCFTASPSSPTRQTPHVHRRRRQGYSYQISSFDYVAGPHYLFQLKNSTNCCGVVGASGGRRQRPALAGLT